MTNYEVKDVLAELFDGADEVMRELSAETDEFTLKQFLQPVSQHKLEAYIEPLCRCQARPATSPFKAAHQHF